MWKKAAIDLIGRSLLEIAVIRRNLLFISCIIDKRFTIINEQNGKNLFLKYL